MILVKSLIVIFLFLLFAVFHKTVLNFLTKLYDDREGFASKAEPSAAEPSKAEPSAAEPSAAEPSKADKASEAPTDEEEIKYTIPATNQKEFFDSAEAISNLQEKLNELMQLNEETSIINKMIHQ
jgi:hypothetical protein